MHVGLPLAGVGQAWSHPPQCASDEAMSTHAPPQVRSPAAQLARHFPCEQKLPDSQLVSQLPQWVGSLVVSVHDAPQRSSGVSQVSWHSPPTQLAPSPSSETQSCAQAPQFAGSDWKSTQTSPHAEYPSTHAKLHCPSTHTGEACSGAVHVAPQPPQFLGLVSMSTQRSLHLTSGSLQSASMPTRMQEPSRHVYPALQRDISSHFFPSRLVEMSFAQPATENEHIATIHRA